ncbi:MAG: FtsH protease activity modulator HflK [Pseudomonadota bacterium]|nr:FtsH protease activity modulator HflK [Pseudomonadota bacterium]
MAWNEPGGNNRDPWGGGNKQDGPPDLDEVLKNLKQKFGGLFGGGGRGDDKESSGGSGGKSELSGKAIAVIAVIALAVWIATGFYIVQQQERAVVLRFGAFSEVTDPGFRWHLPFPIEKKEIVNIEEVMSSPLHTQMLTEDQTIVEVKMMVQYRIGDAKTFLFQVNNPVGTLKNSIESALREIVGQNPLENVLTKNRQGVSTDVEASLIALMEKYKTGIHIVGVNIDDAKPPAEVQDAFHDVNKAEEDKERFVNQAQAYANQIIPEARGEAARVDQGAQAYKAKKIADSEGESQRFLSLLGEYQKAPAVTRQRLYLETAEQVFSGTSKIVMDQEGDNVVSYLPLDQLMKRKTGDKTKQQEMSKPSLEISEPASTPQQREVRPGRSGRQERSMR